MPPPLLSPLEARVLGVLVEKQRAVPDTYPLSLNALTAGCNQKSSRDPVMEATEAEVQAALDALRAASLVVESSGGRVMRYTHNMERVLGLPGPAVVLLASLMLRGPQTAGELRINTERLHRFADISAVEGFLHELAARTDGPLVAELPRAAGTRETRWTHLLSGAVATAEAQVAHEAPAARKTAPADAPDTRGALTGTQVAALEERVAALESRVEGLAAALASLRGARDTESG
jgi:uncharacterized protein YceH (UPF0502 family)